MPAPYPLADLIGEPRPIELAGRTLMIAPLRVRDLAALGAFAMGHRDGPDAIDAARSLPADATPADRAAAFRAAQDAAERHPPDVGSDGFAAAFGSAEGAVWIAYVALRRHNDGFGLAEATDLVAAMASDDPAGFGRLNRRAFGTHRARDFVSLVDPDPDDGPPTDWPRLIDRLAVARGWSYEAIFDLTLPAFWSAQREGKPIGVEYRPRRGESNIAVVRRIRKLLGLG